MRFQNKVVIITGASRGIGKATAIAFAKEGAQIVLGYHEQQDAINELENELQKITKVVSVQGDISKEETAQRFFDVTYQNFGRADILVNNAGAILGRGEISSDDFDKGMRVNLLSTILMTQKFIPLLQKQPESNIINVASTYGVMGAAPVAVYTAAKAGVINYTKSMAVELAPAIRVNAVAPGNIDTDMTKGAGAEFINFITDHTPMKRLGHASEIARSILFLASNEASFITGHTLVVDGGHILTN